MNQCSKILNHLMSRGSITSAVARELYGIKNLSARIKGLRYLGLNIGLKDGAYFLLSGKPKKRERIIEEDDLFPDYIG